MRKCVIYSPRDGPRGISPALQRKQRGEQICSSWLHVQNPSHGGSSSHRPRNMACSHMICGGAAVLITGELPSLSMDAADRNNGGALLTDARGMFEAPTQGQCWLELPEASERMRTLSSDACLPTMCCDVHLISAFYGYIVRLSKTNPLEPLAPLHFRTWNRRACLLVKTTPR